MPSKTKTPQLDAHIQKTPDLVDRIFDYIVSEFPEMRDRAVEIKQEVRAEFGGEEQYVMSAADSVRSQRMAEVLRLFNGRNASEVSRRLNISRASVYRYIKQAGSTEQSTKNIVSSLP